MTKIRNSKRLVLDLNLDLNIVIWNLFVFWCLYFGIWHYFRWAVYP